MRPKSRFPSMGSDKFSWLNHQNNLLFHQWHLVHIDPLITRERKSKRERIIIIQFPFKYHFINKIIIYRHLFILVMIQPLRYWKPSYNLTIGNHKYILISKIENHNLCLHLKPIRSLCSWKNSKPSTFSTKYLEIQIPLRLELLFITWLCVLFNFTYLLYIFISIFEIQFFHL